MLYLKEFATAADYNAAKDELLTPNVSLITDGSVVEYIKEQPTPPVPPTPTVETRVVAKFNVTGTTYPTKIMAYDSEALFSTIEIDGITQGTVVGEYAFSETGEHTVKYTLADSTAIGDNAFENCLELASVTIPSGVTSIGGSAFNDCKNLTSVTIPNGVTSIGDYAFQDCWDCTTIVLPNTVTTIGGYAFNMCSSLTSINIPSGVTSIGEEAFYMCSSLQSMTFNSTIPPTLYEYGLDDTNDCPIYVPAGSVNTYKSATNWSEYAERIEAIP